MHVHVYIQDHAYTHAHTHTHMHTHMHLMYVCKHKSCRYAYIQKYVHVHILPYVCFTPRKHTRTGHTLTHQSDFGKIWYHTVSTETHTLTHTQTNALNTTIKPRAMDTVEKKKARNGGSSSSLRHNTQSYLTLPFLLFSSLLQHAF